jgi:HlyD family secretion protein
VETTKIERKDLVERVRATGRIRPKVAVDVSSNVMGRVERLFVREGQTVSAGDTLLQIDPTNASERLRQAEAEVSAARAALALEEARAEETKAELTRQQRLYENQLTPESSLIAARTAHNVQAKTIERLKAQIDAVRASLKMASHDLAEVTVRSEVSGVIVGLNVEEGENVVTGTMNNAGTVLMTIADLAAMECEVLVDETDVVSLSVGQIARVKIDAFPDTALAAHVTEVGNSAAQRSQLGSQMSASFKVVLLLDELIEGLRPDLTATAEITIHERKETTAVPIRAVTLRDPSKEAEKAAAGGKNKAKRGDAGAEDPKAETESTGSEADRDLVDGVFVVDARRVRFQPIVLGITGERDFEVLSGLTEGDVVVAGPFETLRRLGSGDKVRPRSRGSAARD